MSETVRPVTRTVTVPGYYRQFEREWVPERTYGERTGWVEVVADDGLRAAAATEESARQMVQTMRDARSQPAS